MAFAFRVRVTPGGAFAGGTSWTVNTASNAINAGDLLLAAFSVDNLDSADGETGVVSGFSVGGQAFTKLREYTNANGGAGNGISVALWYFQNSAAKAIGTSTTTNLSGSIAANNLVWALYAFTMDNGQTFTEDAHAFSTGDASTEPGDITLSGLTNAAYLFLRFTAGEGTGTPILNSAGWTAFSGLQDAVSIGGEFHITTATGDTSTQDMGIARDTASMMLAASEGPPGGVAPQPPRQEIGRTRQRDRIRR